MQNLDFYSGKMIRDIPPQFNREDPEYFARLAAGHSKEEHKRFKKASRVLSLIVALCIVSFTAGLIIGIKFASGSDKEIVDSQTKEVVSDIGHKVTNLIKEQNNSQDSDKGDKKLFSKEEFPYVIRVGSNYSKSKSQEIAGIISGYGHTVILSKDNGNYKIYVGPYRNNEEALQAYNDIQSYSLRDKALVIKR